MNAPPSTTKAPGPIGVDEVPQAPSAPEPSVPIRQVTDNIVGIMATIDTEQLLPSELPRYLQERCGVQERLRREAVI